MAPNSSFWTHPWGSYKITAVNNTIPGRFVSKHFYEKSALRISQIFHMNVHHYKGKKRTRPFFPKKFSFSLYGLFQAQNGPKSGSLPNCSKTALTIFLIFCMKLLLNETFQMVQTGFSRKFWFGSYLAPKQLRMAPNGSFSILQVRIDSNLAQMIIIRCKIHI